MVAWPRGVGGAVFRAGFAGVHVDENESSETVELHVHANLVSLEIIFTLGDPERERERDRERDRETDRQTDRQRERQRETDGKQIKLERGRHRDTETRGS